MTFLTCTVPGKPETTAAIASEWSNIVRVYYQALRRELLAHGLSEVVVGVSEIQKKRFLRTGGMPLHLHIVFQGAHRDYVWEIRPERFREMWVSAVSCRVPEVAEESFASAVDVGHVRDNAAGYLGKYISKGLGDCRELVEENPQLAELLPSTWWNMTVAARTMVKHHVVEGCDVGLALEILIHRRHEEDVPLKFARAVEVKGADGAILARFWVGEVSAHWRRFVGLRTASHEILAV